MATATTTTTHWHLKGQGYEFCNCDFGCGCNFGGFPNSKDGSCRALVGLNIVQGKYGALDLSGVKCAGVYAWPKAIHEGNGKVAFVVDPGDERQASGGSRPDLHRKAWRHAVGNSGADGRGRWPGEGEDHD